MRKNPSPRPLGRPRAFKADAALDRAMRVFWGRGYEGTALSDLTKAMRISRPSLYSAFGNKETLFRKVLDRFAAGPASYVSAALEQPTARAVAQHLLYGAAKSLTDLRSPHGCLMVQGALSCGNEADPIRQELVTRRRAAEAAIRKRLERAKSQRDLPRRSSPADLASYLITVMHGMAVQAAGDASRAKLQRVAQAALRAWPT